MNLLNLLNLSMSNLAKKSPHNWQNSFSPFLRLKVAHPQLTGSFLLTLFTQKYVWLSVHFLDFQSLIFHCFLFWWISGLNGKFRGYQSYLRIFGGFRAFRIILSLFAFPVESRPHHRVNLYNHTWSPISVPASIKKDKLFRAFLPLAKPNDCFLLFTLLCQSWIYPARLTGG